MDDGREMCVSDSRRATLGAMVFLPPMSASPMNLIVDSSRRRTDCNTLANVGVNTPHGT